MSEKWGFVAYAPPMTIRAGLFPLALLPILGAALDARGQNLPAAHTLGEGAARLIAAPAPGAAVSLLESLDGTPTDAAGQFTLRITVRGSVTVVAPHFGFAPASVIVPVDTAGPIELKMN